MLTLVCWKENDGAHDFVASWCHDDRQLRLWDLESRTCKARKLGKRVKDQVFYVQPNITKHGFGGFPGSSVALTNLLSVTVYDAVSWHSCLLCCVITPMSLPDCVLHTLDVNLPCVQRSGIVLNNLGDVIRGIATPYYVDVLRHQHRCIRAVSGITRSLRCKPWRSNIYLSPPPL